MLGIGKDYPKLPMCSEEKWVVVELRSGILYGKWVFWYVLLRTSEDEAKGELGSYL